MDYLSQTHEKYFLIRLMKGDDILLSLQRFCKECQEIGAGKISGIGAVSHAILGFYDGHQYQKNSFDEPLEILIAFLISSEAGGVLVTKSKLLSL